MAATIDEAVPEYLKLQPALIAQVANRLWPVILPEQGAVFPALVFTIFPPRPEYSQEGDSNLDTARVQFDCYGRTLGEAARLERIVRTALSGRRFTAGTVEVQSAFLDGNGLTEFDDVYQAWRRTVDYQLTYKVF